MKRVILGMAVAGVLTVGAVAQSSGGWQRPDNAGQSQSQSSQQQGQSQQGNEGTWNERKEQAQEKASRIADDVDIVDGPQVQNLTATSATLTWTTNNNAATRVRYGTDRVNPAQRAYVPGGSREHSVQLTNLKPNTTYHYQIENRGGKDRFKGSFQTPAQ